MSDVKVYRNVHASNHKASFSIARMQDIYRTRSGKVDEPHRHDFYTVLVVIDASGIHKIDFNSYALASNQVFFVSPGQVHQVIENRESEGYAMTFSTQFLIENTIPIAFIDSLNLFHDYGQSPPLEPTAENYEHIVGFAKAIWELYTGEAAMKELAIGAYLKLLLIACNNSCTLPPENEILDISEYRVITAFKNGVNAHYKQEHSTGFYASQLHITPDHLNRIIKSKIGKTAKEYIQSRIITEAKRLLYFSNLSTKEIGYELGFNEPANFSAFFKKCTGCSPSSFKKNEQQSR